MKRWLLILLPALLTACGTRPAPVRIAPAPTSTVVKGDVGKASAAVKETRGGIQQAKADVTAARDEARVIIGELPEDLRPKVQGLEMRLGMALRDLEDADSRAQAAEASLTTADLHIADLQQGIDREHDALVSESDAHAKAESELRDTKAKLSHQTALAWKWRLYTFGIGLAAALWIFKGPLLALGRHAVGIPI